jgi:2-hydroxychromene-2-carboxylate isomerase
VDGFVVSAARLDFFFSFRSPYSYLAAARAFALPGRFAVDVVFRGVIPMAMRGQSVPREKGLHTLRDAKREAVRLGVPFGRIHDPIGAGAMRCLLVAEHAVDAGREREFVLGASRGIWAEAVDVSRDAGLRPICERAGLDWRECAAALDDPDMRARVDANTAALADLGHWGVPLFVFRGELFWGQDRIEALSLALRDAGLAHACDSVLWPAC